ncbi:MAG: Hint domain-containing protein [Anaerovoracaceae bacterium]
MKEDHRVCCFRKGTRVLMADQTEKAIERVEIWDQILSGEGKIATVSNRCQELTEDLFQIETEIGQIEVGPAQPLLTRGGWKIAQSLSREDILLQLEGGARILGIRYMEYIGKVYSLEVYEEPHSMVCNGLVVGDDYKMVELMRSYSAIELASMVAASQERLEWK